MAGRMKLDLASTTCFVALPRVQSGGELMPVQAREPSRWASPLVHAWTCLHSGQDTRLRPIGRLCQVAGSAVRPVGMARPVTGQRIITREWSKSLPAIKEPHTLCDCAPIEAADCRLDTQPIDCTVPRQRMPLVRLFVPLALQPPLYAKGGVKPAGCGLGDFPAKAGSICGMQCHTANMPRGG